jgi:anti-sigma B factor antagonist
MALDLTRETLGNGICLIHADGEADWYTGDALRSLIHDAISDGHAKLALDLRAVEFLDSTGLAVLVGALKRAKAHGGTVVLLCGSDRILKIFRITGLCRVLRVFDSAPAALEFLSASPLLWDDPPGPHQYDVRWQTVWVGTYAADEASAELLRNFFAATSRQYGLQILFELDNPSRRWLTEFLIGASDTSDAHSRGRLAQMERQLSTELESPREFFDAAGLARASAGMILQLSGVVAVKVNGITLSRILTAQERDAFNRLGLYAAPESAAEFLRDPQVDQ